MKNIFKLILSLFIVTGVMMTSCVKDEFDQPEIPDACAVVSGLTPTTGLTIERLLSEYNTFEVLDADGEVRTFPADSNYVFEGVVVSSDQHGNFYKAIYVQDATGGLMLSVDGTNLFNDYKVGQTVHIKLSGLTCHYINGVVGDYETSILELGYGQYADSYGQKIGRIPATVLSQYVKNNSCPKEVTPIDIDLLSTPVPNTHIGRLVRISNVEFASDELDSTYAQVLPVKENRDRHIQGCNGEEPIIVRNSGYATFADVKLPQGNGSITGVYTMYNGTVQFMIRDTTDVQFYGDRCGGETPTGGTFDEPYDVATAISSNSGTGVWVQGFIVGVIETGGDPFVPSTTAPFSTSSNIYIAPTASETDTLKMLIVQLPSGSVKNATNLVDNGLLLGEEIKYRGDLETYFEKDGMKNTNGYWLIASDIGINPDVAGTIWSEDFSTIANPYDPITSMTVVMEAGTKDWHGDGYNGESAEMSAYDDVTPEASNIGWLITPAMDLTSATAPKLTFYSALKYHAGDILTVWVSTDYDGGTSPQTATWTQLTANIVDSSDPVDGASGYNYTTSGDVDLTSYASSSTVYIAWKYTGSGTGGQTTKYRVDDIRIGE